MSEFDEDDFWPPLTPELARTMTHQEFQKVWQDALAALPREPLVYDNYSIMPTSSIEHSVAQAAEPLLEEISNLTDRRVLDMGPETGRLLYYWTAKYGFQGFGIEIDGSLYDKGVKMLKRYPNPNVKLAFGNVFPEDFDVPDDARWGNLIKIQPDEKIQFRQAISDQNPYATVGPLKSFDVFYLYQYGHNTREMLQLISQQAQDGACILWGGGIYQLALREYAMNDWKASLTNYIPSNLKLVEVHSRQNIEKSAACLLQKQG